MRFLIIVILTVLTQTVYSQSDNQSLREVYDLDQKMRSKEKMKDWPLFSPLKERSFRIKVFELLVDGKIKTANDYFHASIILIHSHKYAHENYILAANLAERAIKLGHQNGQFALEAAISKYSLSKNLPSNEWTLYAIDGKFETKQSLEEQMVNKSRSNIENNK